MSKTTEMPKGAALVNEEIREVLSNLEWTEDRAVITSQLDRKMYMAVNKVMEACGGKWDRKAKAHIFEPDGQNLIDLAVREGYYIKPVDYDKLLQWFASPPPLVERMVSAIDIDSDSWVLEPSAGEGAIAKVLRDEGANVDCVEIDSVRFEKLDAAGFNVTKADFLKFSPDREYDFIVMNPPFANYQDIDHVMHAIQFLKPGGRLVSVMSLGWTFHSTKKAQLFRDLEEEFAFRDYEELPAGTFKSSGTNVSSTLVFLEGH